MSERKLMSMVMDASQTDVRRYWTGHGWTTDPLMGIQSQQVDGTAGQYFYLYNSGCQAALVMVELSVKHQQTTVHRIQVHNSVRYGEHN